MAAIAEEEFFCKRKGCNVTRSDGCDGCEDEGLEGCYIDDPEEERS